MAHQIALVPGSTILAMVDPGYPASPIPITAKCTPVDGVVPASTLPWSWPGLVQTWSTLPGAGMTPDVEDLAGRELDWRTSEPPELVYRAPEPLTPYPWQSLAARRFALGVSQGFSGQALLSDDMGCIYGAADMSVHRAGRTFHLPLRDLVHRFNGGSPGSGRAWDLSIPTKVQREMPDGTIRLAEVKAAWSSGVKQTYTVTTETGRTIRATDEHPFLTERGWLRLDQLRVGDLVHVRGQQARGRARKPKAHYAQVFGMKVATEEVVSVEPYGLEETYDVEVADAPHNFLADGFVVHNTGKTISAILSLVEADRALWPNAGIFPALVVCPASVIPAWTKAWQTWAPHLQVRDHRGAKRWARSAARADVLVTSYETMTRDADKLAKLGLGALILDEHHAIKNPQSKRTQAARTLGRKVPHTIVMSGTPIAHGPDDLHPALACLDEKAWPSKERFVTRYCDVVPDEVGGQVAVSLRTDRRSELDLCLAGVQRRVTKAEAAPFLPPKVYSVRTVTMPAEWRKTYDELTAEMIAQLPEDGAELSPMSLLAQMSHLRSLAAAPCKVWEEDNGVDADGVPKVTQHVDPLPGGWKAAELLALLEECPTEQVVVFAPSRKLVDAVSVDLTGAGVSHRMLTGAVNATERQAGIDAFQRGEARVMLATTGAGGVGVTLTAASVVVFLSRPWSLIEALQAEDRAHRIGSEVHDRVEIVDIVTEGTIEAAVRRVLVEKAVSLADVLHDPEIARQVLGGKALP